MLRSRRGGVRLRFELCVQRHIFACKGGHRVAKTFAEYAREREVQMSPESRELGRAFDAAAMFGSLIYRARKVRRLRQIDLAEASGVTQADISRIERGMIVPKVTTLLKLVEALDAQLQFVLLPDDELADDQRDLVTLKVRIG